MDKTRRYILNSAVVTTPGVYQYERINLGEAKEWLSKGDFMSTIGYQETADALSMLTGFAIPMNRRVIQMRLGDEALVFRLALKPGDERLNVALRGNQGFEFIFGNCEIGLLRRISI